MNDGSIPEINPLELARRLKDNENLILLDVREEFETAWVRLDVPQLVYAPMSRLARQGLEALPEAAHNRQSELVVICHHGNRSLDVTAWLMAQGWVNVASLAGGVDAFAMQIDPSIGRY